MRVLIADDSEISRTVLRDAVERLGHEYLVATNGRRAWDLYRRHGADVIISDWMMPELDGATLCRRVRAQEAAPYTYFIFLTVLDDKQHALAGMEAGADDFLRKPLDPDELSVRLVAASRVTALHRRLQQRDAERDRALRRQDAVLRVARRFAAESDVGQLLDDLLAEAVTSLEGDDGTLRRWDAAQELLIPQRFAAHRPELYHALRRGQGASGRASESRQTVIINDYATAVGDETKGGTGGVEAVIATPLLYEGELLGTLTVNTFSPTKRFTVEDGHTLELLASMGAAALVGIERARLDGVLLAVRTMEHELNNQLTLTRGYAEMLAYDPSLPERARYVANEALEGALAAADILARLRTITRVRERHWGALAGSTLDLQRTGEAP